jgi:hypothetical protein
MHGRKYERSFDLEVQTPLSPFSGLGNTSRSQAETLREATRRSEKLQKKPDEERQKNKTPSKKYKRRSFTPSEAYRRKIDQRNVASLRKKTPSKKYKRRSFTPSEAYRRKIDKRNVASLRKKLVDWYARTGCFSVALTLLEGGVVYSGPPALKEFGENKEVKEAFLALIPKPKPVGSYDYNIPEGWQNLNIIKKRKLVVEIATHNGSKPPNWGKQIHRPHWWPSSIAFADPNNGKNRAGVAELNRIICAAVNASVNADDDDDDGGDDDADDDDDDDDDDDR